jgi:hypothetical protein
VTVTGWPGMPVRVTATTGPIHPGIHAGQQVGSATVTVGTTVTHVPLIATRAVQSPSLGWRLGNF